LKLHRGSNGFDCNSKLCEEAVPVFFTMRPPCSATAGSTASLLCLNARLDVLAHPADAVTDLSIDSARDYVGGFGSGALIELSM
jgi:hypothetical protein